MKNEVIQFIEKHIIGKTLFTDEVVYKLENGNLEGVYNDKMMCYIEILPQEKINIDLSLSILRFVFILIKEKLCLNICLLIGI